VLGLSALALLIVLFGGGMLHDSSVELETESTLDAPTGVIHSLIADPASV
jgi:hypothetical protein